jgi:predicted phosphoadenosine phosphosulfate sulfurtransferase
MGKLLRLHKIIIVKLFSRQTVLDAALDRIRFLFDEFPSVSVSFSGGKDSTVILELALIIAREKGRLPLTVRWIDQEAEWKYTVEYCRRTSQRPDLNFRWYQLPLQIFNAISNTSTEEWLQCWDEENPDEWMREKEPGAITLNTYGTKRFGALFDAIQIQEKGDRSVSLTGIRAEEAPTRFMGMSSYACYKGVTWGKKIAHSGGKTTYAMSPLYDWSYTDIWKYIHSNRIDYNEVYKLQYAYGKRIGQMRVSNLHHETAVTNLFFLQEVDRETYEKLTARLQGVRTASKMAESDAFFVKELPYMFADWSEYRDYLFLHLVKPEHREIMQKHFDRVDQFVQKRMPSERNRDEIYKACVSAILTNDYHYTKLNQAISAIYLRDKPAITKSTYNGLNRNP